LEGEKKRELVEGFTAVIFQHEYDHLIGKLFTERIKEQKLGTFIKADEVNKIYYQK
jgi:peptide deformylase